LIRESEGNIFLPNVGNYSLYNAVSTYQKTGIFNYTAENTSKLTIYVNLYTVLMIIPYYFKF
jgi:hypothetical protein